MRDERDAQNAGEFECCAGGRTEKRAGEAAAESETAGAETAGAARRAAVKITAFSRRGRT